MFHHSYFRKKSSISLDIRSEEIRFLELVTVKNQISVRQAKIIPLQYRAVVNGYIDEKKPITERLMALAKETVTYGKQVTIAMPAQFMTIKKISLEKGLKPIEQKAEIQDLLAHDCPTWETEFTYDYILLNRAATTDNFLLVAVRNSLIQSHLEVVRNASWQVTCVDMDRYAFIRAMQFSLGNKDDLQTYIDWDSNKVAQCMMVYENEIIFYREIMINRMSEIKEHLQYGLEFCKNHATFSSPTIYLSPSAVVFASFLQAEGFPIEYLNPFSKVIVPIAFQSLMEKMYLAFGLALRGLND